MDSDMPKALRTPEAFAQLSASCWRLIEAAAPPLALHADKRAVEALANAVEYRAAVVGHRQAAIDYFGPAR